jgi:hypothetical protein
VPILQQSLLTTVGLIEESMVNGFPFEVPAEYANLPLLKGRATIQMTIKYIDNPRVKEETFTIVVDGLNAPVTAGNFVDLVERKFYNGLKIDRSDGFVVQVRSLRPLSLASLHACVCELCFGGNIQHECSRQGKPARMCPRASVSTPFRHLSSLSCLLSLARFAQRCENCESDD